MRIQVNGEALELDDGATVAAVLDRLEIDRPRGIAVAVDAEVVPRGDWNSRPLGEGARVEVVGAIQGG